MKSLIVVLSYHHGNTERVAQAIANVLDASIRTPAQASPEELRGCDLVGFGSGIDSAKHYGPLLEFVDRLPPASSEKAFIFSTCGIPGALARGEMLARQVAANHSVLRRKLRNWGAPFEEGQGRRAQSAEALLANACGKGSAMTASG